MNRGYRLHQIIFTILVFQAIACTSIAASPAETLEEAWKLAFSASHSLKAADNMSHSARLLHQSAQAAKMPRLSLDGGYTILNESPAMLMTTGPEDMEIPLGNDQFYTARATAIIPLYTSGRISHGIEAAESGWQAALADETNILRHLKLRVAESFVQVLQTRRRVAAAHSHVKSLAAHKALVADLYTEGFVPLNDLLAVEVALANARQRLLTSEDREAIALAAYNRFLGRPLTTIVDLEEPEAILPDHDLEELTRRALENRPEIMLLNHQIKGLVQEKDMVYASYGPQLLLNGGYEVQENDYQAHEGVWSMTIGLSLKFDGGVAKLQGDAIGRQREALLEQRLELESIIPLQVKDAWLTLANSQKRVKVTGEALSASEENLTLTTDRYQEGLALNSEVLDAETLRIVSRVNYDNAVYDVVLASLRLRHAIGTI